MASLKRCESFCEVPRMRCENAKTLWLWGPVRTVALREPWKRWIGHGKNEGSLEGNGLAVHQRLKFLISGTGPWRKLAIGWKCFGLPATLIMDL